MIEIFELRNELQELGDFGGLSLIPSARHSVDHLEIKSLEKDSNFL